MRRLLALLLLGAGLVACSSTPDGPAFAAAPTAEGTYRGTALDPARPRPTFSLTDTTGRPYDFARRTRGVPTLLFFGFTHCPDICPTAMADAAAALRAVPTGLRGQVQVVFVTTDPKRDTGPVLAAWLRNFDADLGARFVGLTGTPAQVEAAQVAAKVPVAEDDGQLHSAEMLLYGADDYARVAYTSGSNPADISHDLPIVAGRSG